MAWTIEYTASALKKLRKLDKPTARRIVDFMDERIAAHADARTTGKALTGPLLGAYWRYRVGDFRIICDIQDGALTVWSSRSEPGARSIEKQASMRCEVAGVELAGKSIGSLP